MQRTGLNVMSEPPDHFWNFLEDGDFSKFSQQERQMQPHQERVVAESNELRERVTKLTAFISGNETFGKLDAKDQSLLRQQRDIMTEYLDVLGERIARF
jgi:hypothetical protein